MGCVLREEETSKRNAILPVVRRARRRRDPLSGVLAGISPIIVAIAQ
jgi:hypothetical protein